MNPNDEENCEVALGLNRIDIRTIWRSAPEQPALELKLVKAYWLNTIQPFIAGRKLKNAEWIIANEQFGMLQAADKYAKDWNDTKEGKQQLISQNEFPDWSKIEFKKPEPLLADEKLKAVDLALVAANLLSHQNTIKITDDAIRTAHELILAAEKYIQELPKEPNNPDFFKRVEASVKNDYQKVSFQEILASNDRNSGKMPLLPPVQTGRNEGKLTLNALRAAITRFLKKRWPKISQEEFEKDRREWEERDFKINAEGITKISHMGSGKKLSYQEWQELNRQSFNHIIRQQKISAHLLATIRWERFKDYWQLQMARTQKREQIKTKNA